MSRNITSGKQQSTVKRSVDSRAARRKRAIAVGEKEKHLAQKLANWAQIESGRAELRAGGGKTLEQVLADAKRAADEGGRKESSRS